MDKYTTLNQKYSSFFQGCFEFSLCPYTAVIRAFVEGKNSYKPEKLALGVGFCVFFSTVVPILPSITSITMTLAFYAASMALASMLLTYPLALLSKENTDPTYAPC